MRKWTVVVGDREEALKLAKGIYQRNLIMGTENLSGSTLRGKAKNWGATYWKSRLTLISRLRRSGFIVTEKIEDRGARILVITCPNQEGSETWGTRLESVATTDA